MKGFRNEANILRWPHLQQKIEEEKRDKKRTQVGKERSSNNRTEYLKYEHTPKKIQPRYLLLI